MSVQPPLHIMRYFSVLEPQQVCGEPQASIASIVPAKQRIVDDSRDTNPPSSLGSWFRFFVFQWFLVRHFGWKPVCVYDCMYGCMSVWVYACMSLWVYGCMSV